MTLPPHLFHQDKTTGAFDKMLQDWLQMLRCYWGYGGFI
jgi:hypothetical protein